MKFFQCFKSSRPPNPSSTSLKINFNFVENYSSVENKHSKKTTEELKSSPDHNLN